MLIVVAPHDEGLCDRFHVSVVWLRRVMAIASPCCTWGRRQSASRWCVPVTPCESARGRLRMGVLCFLRSAQPSAPRERSGRRPPPARGSSGTARTSRRSDGRARPERYGRAALEGHGQKREDPTYTSL